MSNPFGKLKIQRDEDEILEKEQTIKAKQDLFAKENQKPKRKIKPSEKQEKQEEQNDFEGFEKVGKSKRNLRGGEEDQGEGLESSKPVVKENKKYKQNRGDQTFKHNNKQRVFDRHESGTGYGKEIKKGGHGGKGTWEGYGQKREIVDYDNTDYHFNKALNPKKETKYVEKTEEVVVEEKIEEVVVKDLKEEEVVEDNVEKTEMVEKPKIKTKKDLEDEAEVQKNKLEVPENALTLSEYKLKNAKITTDTVKTEKVKVDLEEFEKKEDETIGIVNPKAKTKKGAKNQNLDKKDVDLNKMINLKIDDGSIQRTYNNKNYNNNKNKKFRADDLPELK